MTSAELIRLIRKPGKVYVGVLVTGDIAYIAAEKSDLIAYIAERDDSGMTAFGKNGAVYVTSA